MALPKYIQKAQPAANTTIVFLMVTLVSICGCTTNPATGKRVISFNSLAEEKRIGKREHPKIIKQFGGVCENRKINNYVSKIGHQLALVSELPSMGGHSQYLILRRAMLSLHLEDLSTLPGDS